MKLVEKGGEHHEAGRHRLGLDEIWTLAPERPVCEHRQDEVLGDMTKFADHAMPHFDFAW